MFRPLLVSFICSLFSLVALAQESAPTVVRLEPGADLPYRLQTAAILAKPNTVIELPEGKYEFVNEVVIRGSHLTLRGQGMGKTILSFKNQFNGGQGILVNGDTFTAEDFAIEDTPGDGLKLAGVNGITVRRVRVEWTGGPNPMNGSYALYPVQSKNILIEDSVVRGASDAGVYVGQSRNIIVRHNTAENNVAGIEIENSHQADVYENLSTHNTGGILVFDLPDLPVQGGGTVRVYRNKIIANNGRNFAPHGNIVGIVPPGTGFMAMANRDVEVFDNDILEQNLAGAAVISYLVSQLPITDPNYDPIPKRVYIHDNRIEKTKGLHVNFGNQVDFLVNALYFLQAKPVSDVIYDGIGESYNGAHGLPAEDRICAQNNVTTKGKASRTGNLQLDKQRWWLPIPGGPVLTDSKQFACGHEPVAAVVLDDPLPVPAVQPEPSPELVKALCEAPGSGPNWVAALAVNCPDLSQYRLFADAREPRQLANGGVAYDLTTPLFSDYATKHRFVFVPPTQKAKYDADDAFDFPVGTVIAKTFGFGNPERVVETRLLVRRPGGWVGLPYIWRDDRSDAGLALGGGLVDLDFTTDAGKHVKTQYPIPNANECAICHSTHSAGVEPIGPKARLLNRDFDYTNGRANQLTEWTRLGILDGAPVDPTQAPRLPVWNDQHDGTTATRARAYLEVNCAHCHNAAGLARNTGLFLYASVQNPTQLGTCKPPVAAGIGAGNLSYDLVPGHADQSILAYRLNSNHAKVKMPQIGRTVIHEEGLSLVNQWINGLSGKCTGPAAKVSRD